MTDDTTTTGTSKECQCTNPDPETEIIARGQDPDRLTPTRKVTYCTTCTGTIEVEQL